MGKRHKPEEIIAKLRQVEVMTGQGTSMADAIRSIGVTEVTYYRWRSEYGGMKLDQVKRLKELEIENGRLRKAVSDLTLDKLILKEHVLPTLAVHVGFVIRKRADPPLHHEVVSSDFRQARMS